MADWINSEMTRAYERATKAGEARLARQHAPPRRITMHARHGSSSNSRTA